MNDLSSMTRFSKNIYSQKGEDGILEQLFSLIGTENMWCVEFGAWDGKLNSNTANLTLNKNWSAVLIEADTKRYFDLQNTFKGKKNIVCINTYVQFEGPDTLGNILKHTHIPQAFDLLSIDIDGNDYHIWESFTEYRPRVVVIEINPTIPADIDFVQAKDMSVTQGSSVSSLQKLGKKKGYELVALTELNAIFVTQELFARCGIEDTTPSHSFNSKYHTRIFQLYDGTMVIDGQKSLLWHKVDIKQKHIQVIPKFFRTFPDAMNSIQSILFKMWKKLHNRF